MKQFLVGMLIGIIVAIAGVEGYFYLKPKQVVKEVAVTKNVDHKVNRDYSKTDCCDVASKYDLTPFHQTFKVERLNPDSTDVSLKWDLYDRNGEQEIKVPVFQEGNWKFYAGVGLGGVVVGAGCYGIYKLIK